ncbi:hypothetical protein HQ865_03440 [Mucilaginibacter mali]|uniref:DUF3078 domain-containing protein n=1 Tax=Mucilaginibacter mali TaxID=2740462 RepID=A0A7D4PZH4_9SPHI|nr:hypothetical protein [Mucilaginibacter mali]QKJ28846.1 hypothetical protein HQ865_03440 [Mucilaginibacter mali]
MKTRLILTALVFLTVKASANNYSDTTHHAHTDSIPNFVRGIGKISAALAKSNIALRRSFDGAKEEAKPASILWNNDYENKLYYTVLDMAVRVSELDLLQTGHTSLVFYPKFEWHKNSIDKDDKKKNNLTGGINTEFLVSVANHWWAHPFITGSFDYKNDLVKSLETTQTKGFLSFSGSHNFEPGAPVRNDTKAVIFKYYPYTGLEYYNSINKGSQKASFWANRFYAELNPISRYQYNFMQITIDYTFRKVLNDNLYNMGNVHWLSIGANIYPDGKGNLGLGLDYSEGEDPSSNFTRTKMLALGIKLKI